MSYGTTLDETYQARLITATTTIKSNEGNLGGIFVSAASSTPQITIYDGLSTSGTKVIETFTPTAGTYYRLPLKVDNGLHVVISGTVSCTVFYV